MEHLPKLLRTWVRLYVYRCRNGTLRVSPPGPASSAVAAAATPTSVSSRLGRLCGRENGSGSLHRKGKFTDQVIYESDCECQGTLY